MVGRQRQSVAELANLAAMAGDFVVIIAGLFLGFWFRFRSGFIPNSNEVTWLFVPGSAEVAYLRVIALGAVFLFATFLSTEVYTPQNLLQLRKALGKITKGTVFWLFAYLSVSLVLKFTPAISRIYMVSSFVSVTAMLMIWRALLYRILCSESIASGLRQKVLIVGWHTEATRLVEGIHQDTQQPYRIIGCLPAPGGRYQSPPPPGTQRLGDYTSLPKVLARESVDIVVLVDLETAAGEIVDLSNVCERHLVQFKVIPSYFQILLSGLKLETISGVPIMGVSELPLAHMGNRCLKRTVDIVGACVGLAISAPIIAVCGILIYLESPGPILFSQERMGRQGRLFRILKLRSMSLDAYKTDHVNQSTSRADHRLLKIGAFIRRWNLDEVPQFWNVLVGNMSLVGPRPERTFHSVKLSTEIPHYNARLSSKPGITGWAQINGLRGDTDLTERVRFDLHYLENWSLWLDFQIMVQTFFRRDNAY